MTSREMQKRLREATDILELCERVLENPADAHARGDDLELEYSVREFLERHREDAQEEGCAVPW